MAHNFGRVVDHLKTHAGDALQAVIVYDGEDHRDLYRRKDDVELHGSDLETEVLAEIRTDGRQRTSDHADEHEGRLRAVVRLFDERVIVHLPRTDRAGTVVVLDPVVARDLAEFVADVRRDLYDE
jgi:hypothetical protein